MNATWMQHATCNAAADSRNCACVLIIKAAQVPFQISNLHFAVRSLIKSQKNGYAHVQRATLNSQLTCCPRSAVPLAVLYNTLNWWDPTGTYMLHVFEL